METIDPEDLAKVCSVAAKLDVKQLDALAEYFQKLRFKKLFVDVVPETQPPKVTPEPPKKKASSADNITEKKLKWADAVEEEPQKNKPVPLTQILKEQQVESAKNNYKAERKVLYVGKLAKYISSNMLRDQLREVLPHNCKPCNLHVPNGAGYAYLTFTSHEKATKALDCFLTQPTLLTQDQEIIVNFAIDKRN